MRCNGTKGTATFATEEVLLAVEVGRYTGTLYIETVCRLWHRGDGGPTPLYNQLPLIITIQTETIHAL